MIILKALVKNIFEKKVRTLLILFSILLATTLFFCSITISGALINIYTEQIKKQVGSADIVVVEGERAEYKYFSMQPVKKLNKKLEYAIGGVIGHGFHTGKNGEKTVDLYGLELQDLQIFNPIEYSQSPKNKTFSGNKVIISRPFAEETGLGVGDTISFTIENKPYSFTIYAVSQPVGPFTNGTQSLQAIIPKNTYASIVGAKNGDVRIICMKLKNSQDTEIAIKELSALYPNNSVREAISQKEVNQKVAPLSVSFMMISVVVFLLSAFIIVSSFGVIALERLPVIGTYRSIGATKRMTNGIMLVESLSYGVIGGGFGCMAGIGVLSYLSKVMAPPWLEKSAEFTAVHVIMAFVSALALSLFSSIVPIIKTSKFSIKDIVLNSFSDGRKRKKYKLFIGILFLCLRLLLPQIIPNEWGLLVNTFCMVITIVGVVLLMPYILQAGIKILGKSNTMVFGNEGSIATMNLRSNKSMQGSITLLVIGISSLLMINVVTSSVLNGMAGVFTEITNFTVYTSPNYGNNALEQELYSIPQIQDVYSFYTALGVFVVDKNDEISVIEGINPEKYLNYINIDFENGKSTLKQLENGKNILVSSVVKNKMELNKGDKLTLNMETGNVEYTIIGFFDSTLYGSNYAIVSENNLKEDMQMENYSFMYIKNTGDSNEVTKQIKHKFTDRFKDVYTIEELIQNDIKNNGMIYYLLNAFSVVSVLIGVFGIVNNLVVSFMERRRWMAMMKSIGMSKNQSVKMTLIESLTGGAIGGVTGVLTGVSMLLLIPNIMVSMGLVYNITFSVPLLFMYIFASVLVMVLASVIPAIKASKLNIIGAIKYE